jgi:hypothetical protein
MSLMPASSAETAPANCLEGTRLGTTFAVAFVTVAGLAALAWGFSLAAEAFGADLAFDLEGFTGFRTAFLAVFGGAFLGFFDLGGLCFVAIVKSAIYNVYPAQSQAGGRFNLSSAQKSRGGSDGVVVLRRFGNRSKG